jgi:hypothetical protein
MSANPVCLDLDTVDKINLALHKILAMADAIYCANVMHDGPEMKPGTLCELSETILTSAKEVHAKLNGREAPNVA